MRKETIRAVPRVIAAVLVFLFVFGGVLYRTPITAKAAVTVNASDIITNAATVSDGAVGTFTGYRISKDSSGIYRNLGGKYEVILTDDMILILDMDLSVYAIRDAHYYNLSSPACSLTVQGTGTLSAGTGSGDAGNDISVDTLTVNGGTVSVASDNDGSGGINVRTMNVTNGTVNVTCSGYPIDAQTLNISGGTVTADASSHTSAIWIRSDGTVNITGGTVTAIGGSGTAFYASGAPVSISGAATKVTITGSGLISTAGLTIASPLGVSSPGTAGVSADGKTIATVPGGSTELEDTTAVIEAVYTVSFDAGGGSGTMTSVNVARTPGTYTAPANGFTAPAYSSFANWTDGTNNYNPGQTITLTGDITLKAVWTTEPTITTTSLAAGVVGTSYSQTLSAVNVTDPLTWSITSGSLPDGLTLDPATGVISGTPTTAGTYTMTVQVTDSATPVNTVTKTLTITIRDQSSSEGTSPSSGASSPEDTTPTRKKLPSMEADGTASADGATGLTIPAGNAPDLTITPHPHADGTTAGAFYALQIDGEYHGPAHFTLVGNVITIHPSILNTLSEGVHIIRITYDNHTYTEAVITVLGVTRPATLISVSSPQTGDMFESTLLLWGAVFLVSLTVTALALLRR